ncbi:hypothetical protein C8Q80DRAFT_930782 [Daedaleopsis nitida]|nr:hypothetical protein C8Q80DRAFT_930782 [Daedaleopsis nitida]
MSSQPTSSAQPTCQRGPNCAQPVPALSMFRCAHPAVWEVLCHVTTVGIRLR